MDDRAVAVLLAMTLVAAAPAQVPAGRGNAVLLNGFIDDGEWVDARSVDLGEGYRLLLKQDRRWLYAAVAFGGNLRHTGGEIYIADESGLPASYHVSGALGRREFRDGSWSDYEWQPKNWSANMIQTIVEQGKLKPLGPAALEYQIDKSLFKGRALRVRVELRRPAALFPKDSPDSDPAGWITIRL
jgi:hypothetical protein